MQASLPPARKGAASCNGIIGKVTKGCGYRIASHFTMVMESSHLLQGRDEGLDAGSCTVVDCSVW